jgi:hypothetical protein
MSMAGADCLPRLTETHAALDLLCGAMLGQSESDSTNHFR